MDEKILSKVAGQNVKNLIKNSKYKSQDNFAYEFGAEIRTVNRWLNEGIKNIDLLQEIANFFEVEIIELLK